MKKLNIYIYSTIILMVFACSCNCQPANNGRQTRLFAGTYAKPGEKGFYLFDLNLKDGTLSLLTESDAGPNPSYFCISKKNEMIYAANEVMQFNGIRGGGVTTLKHDAKSGSIAKINELAVPNGGPCFISLSPAENFLFMANYSGGSVSVVKLDGKGVPERITDTVVYKGQDGKVSHAHMISPDNAGKMIYVTDLGLNRIVIYDFDSANGQLHQIQNGIVDLPKGAGPRHFVFNSDNTKMYVINELNSTISVFNVEQNGELTSIQNISTLSEGFTGKSYCADIHLGKSGRFLYGSNRGENTIVTYRIESDGRITLAGRTTCGGDWPRNFVIDPSGKYLLVGNQKSGNISVFSIDKKSGLPVEPAKDHKLNAPACLKFLSN
jgi:6-phosphogluconolactonase